MRINSKQAEVAEVDMTPMIDIVFQLIAFFMVITNFEQTQADERVKLPTDNMARPPEVARENELVLNVGYIRNSDGEEISDALVFFNGEEILVESVGSQLRNEAEVFKLKGTKPEDVTVKIRADAKIPTGKVQELIKLAQEANFTKYALSANSGE